MKYLVNESIENLKRDLVGELYKEKLFDELLQEDPRIAIKRKICNDQLDALKKAKKIVQDAELRDLVIQ